MKNIGSFGRNFLSNVYLWKHKISFILRYLAFDVLHLTFRSKFGVLGKILHYCYTSSFNTVNICYRHTMIPLICLTKIDGIHNLTLSNQIPSQLLWEDLHPTLDIMFTVLCEKMKRITPRCTLVMAIVTNSGFGC